MIVADKLCYRSKLRYINGSEKFAYALISLLFCVVSRSLVIALIVFLLNAYLTVKKGGIPFKKYVTLLLVPLAFLIMSTLAIVVNISKTPLDAYAFSVGSLFVTGSTKSLLFAVQLMGTAMASVSCLYFLSLNTTMTDILGVLSRLRCPGLMVELMLLIYRFIFILGETASAITSAQKSRLGYQNYKTAITCFGSMGARLLLRAIQRSNALFDAMESRGYDGKIRVLEEHHRAKKKEVAAIVVFELLLFALMIWRIVL